METSMTGPAEIEQAAGLLAHSHGAVAFTGAGLSTRSGIPDFRSPESGLWARLDAAGVDDSQAGTLQSFVRDPKAFYARMQPLFQLILAATPNPAHLALAELEAMGVLHALITQNADLLQQRAGSQDVIELHGSLATAACLGCYRVVPFRPLLERFLQDGITPRCETCAGVMKPDVILSGEQLPVRAVLAARHALRAADVILAAGTSLSGGPATALLETACAQGSKLILVNQMPTILDGQANVVIRLDVVEALPGIAQAVRGQ
jgi:NAD-dependent deacetylase